MLLTVCTDTLGLTCAYNEHDSIAVVVQRCCCKAKAMQYAPGLAVAEGGVLISSWFSIVFSRYLSPRSCSTNRAALRTTLLANPVITRSSMVEQIFVLLLLY